MSARTNVTIRMRAAIKAALQDSAIIMGRSLSEEIELRLEQTFRDERIEAKLDEILASIKPLRRVA